MRTDIESEGIPTEMPLAAIKIETVRSYEQATLRAADLSRQDGGKTRELEALLDAIIEWEKNHATARR